MQLRPPVRLAVGMSMVVFIGYLATLAPGVTFWDAGEFISAAKTLGIPHPPGSPLYVLLASVWARVIPFGEYAFRTNLLSAICTAAAAGCWCLVVHDVLLRVHATIDDRSRAAFAMLGGISAALLAGFSFTAWQSATETEVYATTTLSTALIALIVMRWRERREDGKAMRLLLAALFLLALSVGSHMMGLLAGPAMLAALIVETRGAPLVDAAARRRERTTIAVLAAGWLLLCGIGLGNVTVTALGTIAFVVAAGYAIGARQWRFVLAAIVVVAMGASTILFLYLRARQHPPLNTGDPSTWHNLLDVVRRAQYPVRTPFDDPTVLHGSDNPGRSIAMLAYQLVNYAQYFDWQWAASIGDLARASIPRLVVTLFMASLAIRGARAHRRGDPTSFAFVATLFLVAGPLLVLYLNFKPGPSIGWDRWLNLADHEVRDRDYFFVASFVAAALWIAIGIVELARRMIPRLKPAARTAGTAVFAIALIPLVLNLAVATRRQTGEATLARDTGRAFLESVPTNGVFFTYGDNDTFPIWYVQQVEGFRRDVTVICLCMAALPTYVAQFDSLYDLPVGDVVRTPFRTPRTLTLDLGVHGVATIQSGAAVYPGDILVFEILRKNAGRRPIAWSVTAADALYGLQPHLVQQGLALVLPLAPATSAADSSGVPLDLLNTRRIVDGWQFGSLEARGPGRLDANIRAVAATLAAPITRAGLALAAAGDTTAAVALLRRAERLAADSTATAALRAWHR